MYKLVCSQTDPVPSCPPSLRKLEARLPRGSDSARVMGLSQAQLDPGALCPSSLGFWGLRSLGDGQVQTTADYPLTWAQKPG